VSVDLDVLDRILREHQESSVAAALAGGERRALIRRATYPDRTTALTLWGSTKYHGQPWADQPGIERIDRPDDVPERLRVPASAPHVFLSHAHQDRRKARRLAESLAEMGIGCWMFESHIELRGPIAASVRRAIQDAAAAIGFTTRDSIASLWVLTELQTAQNAGRPVILVVDSTDASLLHLLESARFLKPDEPYTPPTYDTDLLDELEADYRGREGVSRAGRYRSQVQDFLTTLPHYLAGLPALSFPGIDARWPGPVTLRPLTDLPGRLRPAGVG
jgi:hypothetical protein